MTRSAEVASQGLRPGLVRAWQARIGADDPVGPESSRYLRRSGVDGIAHYMPTMQISAAEPESFDEVAFWRPLSEMIVYALLRTPCTMSRTPELVAEYPSPYVLVGTQSMPGSGSVRQGAHECHYQGDRQMLIVDNSRPFVQTSHQVADLAGVWIPKAALGIENDEYRWLAPVLVDSPLGRAGAAFVRSFAFDSAARGAQADLETELAVIDVIRSILQQQAPEWVTGHVPADPTQIRAATQSLIDRHFREPGFSADSIAHALHMSRRHLHRYFSDTEDTPSRMLALRRLERARELLAHRPNATLSAVAAAAGFTSTATLRNRFRAEFDMTPNEFRRLAAGERTSAVAERGDA